VNRSAPRTTAQRVGLWLGLGLFLAMLWLPVPAGFEVPAWRTAALAAGPLLGIVPVEQAGSGYGSSTIFLILGGCLLALALERWQLHRRIAYLIVTRAGTSARGLVLGVMAATAFVSVWVSNTSTTLMMLPVVIVLAVAYAATIGGLATLIGTPTNALAVAFLEQTYGVRPTFAEWLIFGLPCSIVMLVGAWWVLVAITHPFRWPDIAQARELVQSELRSLGRLSAPERRVAAIGVAAAVAWVTSPWLKALPGLGALSDMGIAMLAGLALFLVPSGVPRGGTLLEAGDFRRLPWDTLFLSGGGLALASLIQDSGLSVHIGELLGGVAGWPPLAVTAVVVLVVPAAVAASCAFMLPVGTAPNAIVFGSGRVQGRDMLRAGIWVNILGWGVIIAVSAATLRWLA